MWSSISKLGSGAANWFHKRVVDPLVLILKRYPTPTLLHFYVCLFVYM